jgi:hypothetical protein
MAVPQMLALEQIKWIEHARAIKYAHKSNNTRWGGTLLNLLFPVANALQCDNALQCGLSYTVDILACL